MLFRALITLTRCVIINYSKASRKMSTKLSPSAKLDKSILQKYLNLPIPGTTTLADYVWIDGSGSNLRSRTRTLNDNLHCVEQVPQWLVDGSKTNQRSEDSNDIRLMPVAMYNDPTRRGEGGAKLILCEAYSMDYKPLKSNNRSKCCQTFADTHDHHPLFGFCQQYTLVQVNGTPFGWPGAGAELPNTGAYYCGVGARNAIGREIVEAHARACLYAGIALSGFHSEQQPSKWKFEIEPTKGIKAPDDVIMARYLLQRIAAEFGLDASFHPKMHKNKSGCGLHVKFTTSFMAECKGIKYLTKAAKALAKKHKAHMKIYDPKKGKYNRKRLGKKFNKFSWGSNDRSVSVLIPADVQKAGCGFLEDRRPAANSDPYAVCDAIMRTTLCQDCLDGTGKKRKAK